MSEEDYLKQKKIQELMEKANAQKDQEIAEQAKINQILNAFLTDPAKERLSNVRLVNKNLFQNALQAIVFLAQQGKIEQKIDDDEMKVLLERLNQKKEINIRRK